MYIYVYMVMSMITIGNMRDLYRASERLHFFIVHLIKVSATTCFASQPTVS